MAEKKQYRNVFAELGISQEEIDRRLEDIFQTLFYGNEDERFYWPVGEDMGRMVDTGNIDVRTEGMSYGMMMCVQMNKKEEFDRIWKWSYTYMYNKEGTEKGYFGWSAKLNGELNSHGAAPDGEEFFAMALFLAGKRWGDGEGLFEYSKWARTILSDCLHKGENGIPGSSMWNKEKKLILFVAGCEWSDPSYHLPHFYECFAQWANEEDRAFWKEAAEASRAYLIRACHPITGMSPEYGELDGSPKVLSEKQIRQYGCRHDWFFSDAYRTIANIALDAEWFGGRYGLAEDPVDSQRRERYFPARCADHIQTFFFKTVHNERGVYLIDGTMVEPRAKHYLGLSATLAQASLASDGKYAMEFVKDLWESPVRTDQYRYYDNCLYFFAFLALSGRYRMGDWEDGK